MIETSIQLLHVLLIYSIAAISVFSRNKIVLLIGILLSVMVAISWAISEDTCMFNDWVSRATNISYERAQQNFASKYLPFDSKFIRPLLYFAILISFWKLFD